MALRWSVIIPYYNEADFLPKTVASLVAQTVRPLQLIFVDNASTDNSTAIIQSMMIDHHDIEAIYLHEPQPGQISAMQTGLAHVTTEFVATCDADTFYPPHYLKLSTAIFDATVETTVAVMAFGLNQGPERMREIFHRYIYAYVICPLLKYQCHTGGYGQTFRTSVLKTVGGYSTQHWRYILSDHEIMNRMFRFGESAYHPDLWCITSNRRTASVQTRWSLVERILYHVTPHALKDWFFYSYLEKRFAARQLDITNLRLERAWESGH